jgi:hypothetical protein
LNFNLFQKPIITNDITWSEKEDPLSCVKTNENGKKRSFLKSLNRYGLLRIEEKGEDRIVHRKMNWFGKAWVKAWLK